MSKPTKEQYEAAAIANGWRFSPAYGGWIHDEALDQNGHIVQDTAEDACFFDNIDIEDEG